jgi:hypothetical protein
MGRLRRPLYPKVVSLQGAPIGIAAKRRTWRAISNLRRRNKNLCRIRYLGGGGDSLERTRLQRSNSLFLWEYTGNYAILQGVEFNQ